MSGILDAVGQESAYQPKAFAEPLAGDAAESETAQTLIEVLDRHVAMHGDRMRLRLIEQPDRTDFRLN